MSTHRRYAPIGGPGGLFINKIRIKDADDVSLTSTDHGLQIGPSTGQNLRFDVDEILSVSNGTAGTLNLQSDGGVVSVGINTAARLDVANASSLRILDAADTDYMDAAHDGTDLNLTFVNTADFNFFDGVEVVIWDSADTDNIRIRHDGGEALIGTSANSLHLAPNSGLTYCGTSGTDSQFRVYDSGVTQYVQLAHDTTDGEISNTTGDLKFLSTGIFRFLFSGTGHADLRLYDDNDSDYMSLQGSTESAQIKHNGGATFSQVYDASVGDDETITFTMPGNYNMIFIVTSYNDTAYCQLINDTNTVTTIHAGAVTTIGGTVDTAVNVDARLNVWVSSGGDVLNIKNRLGSARTVSVFVMSTS